MQLAGLSSVPEPKKIRVHERVVAGHLVGRKRIKVLVTVVGVQLTAQLGEHDRVDPLRISDAAEHQEARAPCLVCLSLVRCGGGLARRISEADGHGARCTALQSRALLTRRENVTFQHCCHMNA
jgi:hypothetical protein